MEGCWVFTHSATQQVNPRQNQQFSEWGLTWTGPRWWAPPALISAGMRPLSFDCHCLSAFSRAEGGMMFRIISCRQPFTRLSYQAAKDTTCTHLDSMDCWSWLVSRAKQQRVVYQSTQEPFRTIHASNASEAGSPAVDDCVCTGSSDPIYSLEQSIAAGQVLESLI